MIQERGCNLDDEQPPETLRNIPSQNHITPNQHEDRGAVDIQRQHHEHHATDALLCRGRGNTSIQTFATKSYSTFSKQEPSSFQPRAQKEAIRNCTTLDRSLKEHFVNGVARYLLGLPLSSDDFLSPSSSISEVEKGGKWRKGGKEYSLANHINTSK